jgi:hypothetical protein
LLPKGDTETQDTDLTKLLALIMGRQLYTYLPPLSGADEVSGYQWQLVATMHLIFVGDTCKVMVALILLVFVLAWLELTHSDVQSVFVEFSLQCY